MPDGFKVELSAEAKRLMAQMGATSGMLQAVARKMDQENQLTIAHISSKRMRGNDGKPFPVDMHILGIRTGRLYKSLRNSAAVVSGSAVESSIGTNVKYAGIHEFGGRIKVGAHKRTLRFKTELVRGQKEKVDKRGNVVQQFIADQRRLAKQGKNGNLWVFARKKDKNAQEATAQVAAYEFDVPARAPITTGIQDRLEAYGKSVSQSIVNFWNRK